jgi:cell volume regulation protein A
VPLIEHLLILSAAFLALAVLASKVAARSGVPVLLLFLALGMLAGSEGIGGLYFDNAGLAQAVGVVALVLILFAGGLTTRFSDVRPVLGEGVVLATVGVAGTALVVGLFAQVFLGFSLAEGVLLGAIISSTDAAAVLGLLRGRGIRLPTRLKSLLELESGSNDPMAVFLTLGMIQILQQPEASPLSLVPLFVVQMSLGLALGLLVGRATVYVLNRARLEYDGLYPVVTLAAALGGYSLTTVMGGNGFLAVYVAALVMGNRDFIHRNSLSRFHDGLAWLGQIVMFLTLGLQVYPSRLVPVAGIGLVTALVLMFLARPAAVLLTMGFNPSFNWREKVFIAWVGLRGAAPIILATFPLLAGLARADELFHLVFFIVIMSVLLQGMSLGWVARRLGVEDLTPEIPSPLAEFAGTTPLTNDVVEMVVPTGCGAVGRQLLDLGLPGGTLVVLIRRGAETIIPNGSTMIEPADVVLVVAKPDVRERVRQIFAA